MIIINFIIYNYNNYKDIIIILSESNHSKITFLFTIFKNYLVEMSVILREKDAADCDWKNSELELVDVSSCDFLRLG